MRSHPVLVRLALATAAIVAVAPAAGAIKRDGKTAGSKTSTPLADATTSLTATEPTVESAGTGDTPIDDDRQRHDDAEANATSFDPKTYPGSLYNVARMVRADAMWNAGFDGRGIDVAVIDTGVAPVTGLTSGNVVRGPDVSLDANGDALDGIDAFGHGTHMTGIVAGRDPRTPTDPTRLAGFARSNFVGIAPGARVINVKAGAANGAVDVSQLIAAIDWVVQNRNTDGRNIRVLNLSFGTTGVQDYRIDPLTFAVENAWRKGIVVIVSAGNDGVGSDRLDNPAYDPHVIAVGALDHNGTLTRDDDFIADFSSRGTISRRPDFLAPGRSIVSLRTPGSVIDTEFPEGVVVDRFFKGSGTSQAAAVASGATALLLQRFPDLTPDQVKALLALTGRRLPTSSGVWLDTGMRTIDLANATTHVDTARLMAFSPTRLVAAYGTGTGSLDAARGDDRLTDGATTLSGEIDLTGRAWNPTLWTTAAVGTTAWSGNAWLGAPFAHTSWSGRLWNAMDWSGRRWAGTWDGRRWASADWQQSVWSGRSWRGDVWSGDGWTSRRCASGTWT